MKQLGRIVHALVVAATCDVIYALMCNGSVRNLLKNVTVSSTYAYYADRYYGKENLCLHTTEDEVTVNGVLAAGEGSSVLRATRSRHAQVDACRRRLPNGCALIE